MFMKYYYQIIATIFCTSLILSVSATASENKLDLAQIELIQSLQNATHPVPKYEIISSEKLEKRCEGKDKNQCAHTLKITLMSNDGFLFEVYQSDNWSGCEASYPCSTIGDLGAGRHEFVVKDMITKKKIVLGEDDFDGLWSARMKRVPAPIDYPYLIISHWSGGASCCFEFHIYLKSDISLPPYKTPFSRSDYLFATQDQRIYYGGWTLLKGRLTTDYESAENQLREDEPFFIEDLVENYFEHGQKTGEWPND